MASSPPSSGVLPPSYPLRLREPPLTLRNPRSILPVADLAALLLRAAYDGDVPQLKTLVKRLRKAGKSVDEAMTEIRASWYKGQGPLHMAALSGKTAVCKLLIKDLKLDVDAAVYDGVTPLSLAILGTASAAVTRLLLDHHADPNKAAFDGCTPLHLAATRDAYEIAELLLSRRAYVDPVSECGTPLYIAAKNGSAKMLKLLLRHQADPNRIVCTPLKAISACSLEGMELPTKAHADVNAGTVTPLIAAAYAGSTDCIKCLLKAGADANIPDQQNGRVPIEFAATQRWKECVDVLFPVTTPLAKVADWSTTGIIEHSKLMSSKPQDENDGSDFEAQGDAAIGKSDYAHALTLYTMAVEINPDDSSLYAKRSLCSLHAGDKSKALDDANIYKDMQPELSKSRSEQAAALILVKEYDRAVEVLMTGLSLDFERKPTDKALR
ncbi:hypothetical protein SORBI_3002G158500 [Sorghum bicolor]|uniref:Uncharacterized protein n=1 Tax=Sorghum bicolor TaxID=4558 RepID=A0A1W0W464_SORBI|nr:hypothetical protein SORBI_3002G158500 [Sorghum bicolor]OQU89198.1 hypothetical protein SORBI_3002G158500 [Sorghum bicolor]